MKLLFSILLLFFNFALFSQIGPFIDINTGKINVLFNTRGSIELYLAIEDSAVVIEMAQNEYHQITNGDSLFSVITNKGNWVVQGDSIKTPYSIYYRIDGDVSFKGTNVSDYHGDVFIDNIDIYGGGWERGMSTTDAGVIAFRYFGYIEADKWIKFMIENTANDDDPTINRSNIIIEGYFY